MSSVKAIRTVSPIVSLKCGLNERALIFCDVAPRDEHLQGLACADVFLDAPAYNAHTLGCDTLFAGAPMISLLRTHNETTKPLGPLFVDTEKLASRVGASLLKAAGLEELICLTMREYANVMVKLATNYKCHSSTRQRLVDSRYICPLFDTRQWVENLELTLAEIALDSKKSGADMLVMDETNQRTNNLNGPA